MAIDARSIARALGGEVSGPGSVVVPGPGHSRQDRSLSVKIDPAAPHGLLVHSFAGDDFKSCRDHVFAGLGLSSGLAVVRTTPVPTAASGPTSSEPALRLWQESI